MAQHKFSRQREAIKDYLMSTKEHPTAETVYENIRLFIPNISLGTVYRNLALLVETGEAVKIPCSDGSERFDGDTTPHYHFMCERCKKIFDINMPDLTLINEVAARNFDGIIRGHSAYFYGLCASCSKEESDSFAF